MSVTITVAVEVDGKLFAAGASDYIVQGLERTVRDIVDLGEQRLDEMLRPRPAGVYLSFSEAKKGKYSTGRYRKNLHAKSKGLHGRIDDGGVIYGPWLEGTSSRNQTTRFKGYSSFRKTAQLMQEKAPEILTQHMNWAVAKLES